MNWRETLDFLYSMLPMYQRAGKAAYKKDLSNTLRLMEALDNPHNKFKSVHIAGTNGKGTSAHGIAAILQSAGYNTGLYTSPHLKNFTERIRLNGKEIDRSSVIDLVDKLKPVIETIKPSFFEVTVAMAFWYFAEKKVDIAIIETGLGGRLDSTNVIKPEVALITNIGLDHTDLLGDTLEKIAVEKAGIIKSDVPLVLGLFQEEVFHVFRKKAEASSAELIIPPAQDHIDPNVPYFKARNMWGIIGVINALRKKKWEISEDAVNHGIANLEKITGFKGRFQVIKKVPLTIADVSHNTEGLSLLFSETKKILKGRLIVVFGTVKDKDLHSLFDIFPLDADYLWTQSNVPRALPVTVLAEGAKKAGLYGQSFVNVNEALNSALAHASESDLILITGSTFVVAEVNGL